MSLLLPLLASGYSPASLGVRARPSFASSQTIAPRHACPSFVATHAAATDEARWLTHAIRLAHVGALGSALAFPAVTNNAVGAVWRGYSSLALTRHPMFEACWAVTVFLLTIIFFESLHLWRPGVLRHRLDGRPPARPLRFLRDHWHKAAVPAFILSISTTRRDLRSRSNRRANLRSGTLHRRWLLSSRSSTYQSRAWSHPCPLTPFRPARSAFRFLQRMGAARRA